MTQDKQNAAPEENVLIKVNNQVSNEKNLSISKEINTLLFKCFTVLFSTAIIFQIIGVFPTSYKLQYSLPTIVLCVFVIIYAIKILLGKVPTLQTYLLMIAALIGAILGA